MSDPVLSEIQRLRARLAELQGQAQEPPGAAAAEVPPIELTIHLPPLEVHVTNETPEHPPVHVTNEVNPAPVHVTPTKPTVKVNVPPSPGPKRITFQRDGDGRISGAVVSDG